MNDEMSSKLPWAIGAGGAVVLALAILLGVRLRSEPPVPEAPKRPVVRRPVAPPAPLLPEETGVSGEVSTPVDTATVARTAEAMDWTGLRYQANRLRMAALEGDEAGRISAAAGLRLYGDQASRFLKEETERERDPVVRAAFEEARKGLK